MKHDKEQKIIPAGISANSQALSEISRLSGRIGAICLALNFSLGWIAGLLNGWGHILYNLLSVTLCIWLGARFLNRKPGRLVDPQEANASISKIDSMALTILFLSISTSLNVAFLYGLRGGTLSTGQYSFDNMASTPNLLFFTVGILGPIVEEVQFRGIYLGAVRKHGALFSIITSSAVFGLSHIGIKGITSFVAGILTGSLYVITGNLFWPVLLHFLNNSGILYWPDPSGQDVLQPTYTLLLHLVIFSATFLFCCKQGLFGKLKKQFLPNTSLYGCLKEDKEKYKAYFSAPGMVLYLLIFGLAGIASIAKALTA